VREFTVYITETTVRPVVVTAENPADAERIAEENHNNLDVIDVTFEADPICRRQYL